jgi:hypothetical protein
MPQRSTIAGHIAPAARVLLDRRIVEERMVALHPPFERPDWLYGILGLSFVPNAFVMDATGAAARSWVPADEVGWSSAVAVRFETSFGNAIYPDALDLLDADEDYE